MHKQLDVTLLNDYIVAVQYSKFSQWIIISAERSVGSGVGGGGPRTNISVLRSQGWLECRRATARRSHGLRAPLRTIHSVGSERAVSWRVALASATRVSRP